jgi:predicted DsbA family dithiol-disulfide isomerase
MTAAAGPTPDLAVVDFWFDPMCPWAYQTSVWIRRVRTARPVEVRWRFFSLEEVNRPDGKRHPWERPLAYGWTPMRVAAWLRRIDMSLCDAWYEAAGEALHVQARRCYDRDVAIELLARIGAPDNAWDDALADPTTHDDVRADHEEAVGALGGFGVPILVIDGGRPVFGPVVVPAPAGEDAVSLWDLTVAYSRIPGLYEMKTPKTSGDLTAIAGHFSPYFAAREWESIQRPAP